MADIVITAANVVADNSAKVAHSTAGATVTAGQAVYTEGATGRKKLADCNSATAEVRVASGIALNGASNGQPLAVLPEGRVTIGGVLVPGTVYCLSSTPGAIRPVSDNTTGDYPCIVGVAVSASVLDVQIQAAGVALA